MGRTTSTTIRGRPTKKKSVFGNAGVDGVPSSILIRMLVERSAKRGKASKVGSGKCSGGVPASSVARRCLERSKRSVGSGINSLHAVWREFSQPFRNHV
jgi:hypothetical protein